MTMNITPSHLLDTARQAIIHGGAEMVVRRFLVIHFTAGASAQSSIDWWKKLANGICAHLVIDRDGTIYQCRPFNRTAGHAGTSRWRDPNTGKCYGGLNSCSIGIELANGGDSYPAKFTTLKPTLAKHKHQSKEKLWETYSPLQLAACTQVSKLLCQHYNLDDLIGHDDIAPDRKLDPGPAFPMQVLRQACGFQGLPPEFQ